ncbi:MAG: ribosomal-processing cysteine protease Prp [Spirochaetes bacterium]|nr:ribosomal-processing cysteine protease Prp [Spirochaetota bacterium]
MKVTLELDSDGCLAGFSADGHAGGAPGANLPCAAVTVLLRTAARTAAAAGLAAGGGADAPGAMRLQVNRAAEGRRDWLRGVTDTLLRGLADVAAEAPGEVEVRIVQVER